MQQNFFDSKILWLPLTDHTFNKNSFSDEMQVRVEKLRFVIYSLWISITNLSAEKENVTMLANIEIV